MSLAGCYILTITCPDRVGIVAAVTSFLGTLDAFITEAEQYGDPISQQFFMRVVFKRGTASPEIPALKESFAALAARFEMRWHIYDGNKKPRLAILVSRFGHCLNDLLHRVQSGTLAVDVPLVISNHPDMRALVEWHGIAYHHLPVDKNNKPEQEAEILRLLAANDIELVVLARYMQVLSPELSSELTGRCINIHHSFLPSFKGAKPYHQAHSRGVKLIGATAHYVTDDLDEGPIIDQEVERVDHTYDTEDYIRIGADIESVVLARAVRYHCERRVLLNGVKTVVFK
jgi:formyltetrahydrofolate deformylase